MRMFFQIHLVIASITFEKPRTMHDRVLSLSRKRQGKGNVAYVKREIEVDIKKVSLGYYETPTLPSIV